MHFHALLPDAMIYVLISSYSEIVGRSNVVEFACTIQIINKTDLAAAVGADLGVMERDALRMRDGGPFVFAQVC